MINFYELTFRRVILHEISAKQTGMEHAIVVPEQNLFMLSQDVEDLIKERLTKASQSNSKAFELEIEDHQPFFSHVFGMKKQNNEGFIRASIDIAHSLAEAQTKSSIPSGFLMIIEGFNEQGKSVYIALKAELHTALRYEMKDQKSYLQLFDDIFLTPSQKLFKIGIIYERSEIHEEAKYPNNEFGSFFYDSQFTVDSKPAEYFWKDFLGFSISKNAKIQSKRFYDSTENFIKTYVETSDEKKGLIEALKQEFLSNDESDMHPNDFAKLYFQDPAVQDAYANEVATYLPAAIEKDPSLIKAKLDKKKITFPNNIVINGPERTFDYAVEIIKSVEDMEKLDLRSGEFTLLKIIGKPYQD